MHNFEIPPNNAQKIDSIMYEIHVYNLGLTPELNTLKLYYAWRCHERENLLSYQGKNTAAEGGSSLYKRPLVLFITQLKRKKREFNSLERFEIAKLIQSIS